ncbi:FAD-dependent oxidoreductase [Jiella endophytica]|uniref:FAD-dependent oxidoreductase n=1 Tax=Jiella endophytica TaxID=2558362 RepID=A0A4Y8RDR5_9HYPH|nr:FAD-dependent oxidoreductase [Jiella endophytica]TFF19137.1 FAD-dependent oxidoreductase [Jiella endophytica]
MPFDPKQRPPLDRVRDADLIILGSGASGLTAALTALLAGLRVVVLEKAPHFGGTTARSSGTAWVPNNRMMRNEGITGDDERAATYLEGLVGNRGPRRPWQAFLDTAPRMQADLADRAEIAFRPMPAAPDYRPEIDGAGSGWRPLEPLPFDGRKLGGYFDLLAPPIPELTVFGGMMVTRAEAGQLVHAEKSLRAMMLGARLTGRYVRDRLKYKRGTRLVMGNGLVARLLHEVLKRGGLVYEDVTVTGLNTDDGEAVTGVSYQRDGKAGALNAARGVVLAGGGYPSSQAWRARELPTPTPDHSPAAPFACGTTIELALAIGATLGAPGLDNGLWFPSSLRKRADGSLAVFPHIALDRAKPGGIIVNQRGRRFANEALSYHDFVRAMYAANDDEPCIPAWIIGDRRFLRRYGMGIIRPRTPFLKPYLADGYLKYGATVEELAAKIDVPAEELQKTIQRFNGFVRSGVDEDFSRGSTIYQRSNGDPAQEPNPCIGTVGETQLYAVELHPTPLGTSRGLSASIDGEVLRETGDPIPGLYVCGNDMQSCFAGEYPGAGAQIGMGMTFGWRVARCTADRT